MCFIKIILAILAWKVEVSWSRLEAGPELKQREWEAIVNCRKHIPRRIVIVHVWLILPLSYFTTEYFKEEPAPCHWAKTWNVNWSDDPYCYRTPSQDFPSQVYPTFLTLWLQLWSPSHISDRTAPILSEEERHATHTLGLPHLSLTHELLFHRHVFPKYTLHLPHLLHHAFQPANMP